MDIITTSNFHATVLHGQISVVFIPTKHVRQCSWPLLQLLLYGGCSFDENEQRCAVEDAHVCRSVQAEVFSIVCDQDGATLFMDPNGIQMFKQAGMEELITVAPQEWRAIQIHLGPMVAEFPGVISFLSKLLAEDNISILNMSTFDTDIIYVQEADLDAAISCLQSKLQRGVHGLKEAKEAELLRPGSASNLLSPSHDHGASAEPKDSALSSVVDSEQYLVVYKESLALVRLQKDAIRDSAYGLTQLVLLSFAGDSEESSGSDGVSYWSYCETAEEVTLIVTERCLSAFAEESIIVSPDRWRAIKLSGRTYGFDETGVVAAMSSFKTDTQVLNVCSFGSNVTFVLEHTLEDSVATLCTNLSISHVER